jgi:hypothetical protein
VVFYLQTFLLFHYALNGDPAAAIAVEANGKPALVETALMGVVEQHAV